MQHQEQQQQLARAPGMLAPADINVLCVSSELHESARASSSAPPSHAAPRQRAAVQTMAGRAYHATSIDSSGQAAVPVSGTVA